MTCSAYPNCAQICTLASLGNLWCTSNNFAARIEARENKDNAIIVLAVFVNSLILVCMLYGVLS